MSTGCSGLVINELTNNASHYMIVALDYSKTVELVCFVCRSDTNSLVTYLKHQGEFYSIERNALPSRKKMDVSDKALLFVFVSSCTTNIQFDIKTSNMMFTKIL